MKTPVFLFLFAPLISFGQSDTLSIFYAKDEYHLSKQKVLELKIDSLMDSIHIRSYADFLGSTKHNLELSQNRANSTKELLKEIGISSSLIRKTEGMGEIGDSISKPEGVPQNRRTDIILFQKSSPLKSTLSDQIEDSKIGSKLILRNLSFVPGNHTLLEESEQSLDSLFMILKENPKLKIRIEGHVCCSPGESDGFDQLLGTWNLSEERARFIYNRLINRGIEEGRLSFKGYAKTNPIFPLERNPTEQQANRRVEIKIIDK